MNLAKNVNLSTPSSHPKQHIRLTIQNCIFSVLKRMTELNLFTFFLFPRFSGQVLLMKRFLKIRNISIVNISTPYFSSICDNSFRSLIDLVFKELG